MEAAPVAAAIAFSDGRLRGFGLRDSRLQAGTVVAVQFRVHIAFVTETYPPELNGVSATVARAVSWLRARGHLLHLVRPRQRGESAKDDAEEWRVAGLALPMYRDLRMGLPVLPGLKLRWRKRRPDVIHVATEGPLGWAACRAGRRLGVPVTSDLRTNFDLYSDYYGLGFMRGLVSGYLRSFHNATDRTFVPTRALAASLHERGFEQLSVVGRGVDAERFAPARRSEQLRQAWGAAPDDPVILHVGRLAAEKNIPLVLRAFESMRTLRLRARLVLVGAGPLRQNLERTAPPGVVFAGELRGQELAEHYASSDIFLFPSLTETFGNVTLEALAAGLVVVAFDVAAASVHITHGASGFVAEAGNETQFVVLARRAVADLHRLTPMRQAARHAGLAASWDSTLSGFEDVLLSVGSARQGLRTAYAD